MQATAFAGANVSGKRVAVASTRRCSHVVRAAVAVPAQVCAPSATTPLLALTSGTSRLMQRSIGVLAVQSSEASW
jgi:hypothetical protein